MATVRSQRDEGEFDRTAVPGIPGEDMAERPPAWEQIENGRYMPRRIRGSYRGRELG